MVLLELVFMARTEHVESVFLPDNGEWHLKIKCGSCNEQFPKEVTFTKFD